MAGIPRSQGRAEPKIGPSDSSDSFADRPNETTDTDDGGSAQHAKLLGAPVVLVVDALQPGDTTATAYAELDYGKRSMWGAGQDADIVQASLLAILSGINRAIVNCSKGPLPPANFRLDLALGSVLPPPNRLRRPEHVERPGACSQEEERDQADPENRISTRSTRLGRGHAADPPGRRRHIVEDREHDPPGCRNAGPAGNKPSVREEVKTDEER